MRLLNIFLCSLLALNTMAQIDSSSACFTTHVSELNVLNTKNDSLSHLILSTKPKYVNESSIILDDTMGVLLTVDEPGNLVFAPSLEDRITGTVTHGEVVKILNYSNAFFLVKNKKGEKGYIHERHFALGRIGRLFVIERMRIIANDMMSERENELMELVNTKLTIDSKIGSIRKEILACQEKNR